MTLQLSSYVKIQPSFEEPELLMQWTQPSGFPYLLADSEMKSKIGEEDLLVYARQVNLRTKIAAGQASSNRIPGVDIVASQLVTATYRTQVHNTYNHHDENNAGIWGINLPSAYQLGHRQYHFQLARDAALKGMNPANGEGVLNAPGVTVENLPADPWGNDSFSTYDNGSAAFLLANIISAIKTRTLQNGIGRDFTIIGPQRVLSPWQYNVVQLTQFQREGAGTASTAQTLKSIVGPENDRIVWTYDDTLIGAGSGGTDVVIISMPEIEVPAQRATPNLNQFAELAPNNKTCNTQYCSTAAPVEITSPMAQGMVSYMTEWRFSSLWAMRPQATTVLEGTF